MQRKLIRIPRIRRRKPIVRSPGAVPGTLGTAESAFETKLHLFRYDDNLCEHSPIDEGALDQALTGQDGVKIWLDVQGFANLDLLRKIAEMLGLHLLTLEDIVHTHQRPKLEEFDDHLFVVLRAIRSLDHGSVENEQVSMVLKDRLLVTFQEHHGDGFEPIRKRLEGKGRIRAAGVDYLCWALMDVIIDNYFPVLEAYGSTMDQIDDAIRENPTIELSRAIHGMRRELRQFRRAVWPLRDVVGILSRHDIDWIDPSTRPSFRDCYDHIVQVSDFVDGTRERASDLADLHLVMVSERTNQVMKVLTMIATIFIPLTFLCGLYGMNFDPEASPYNMPELKWRYGYPVFLVVLILIFLLMLGYFRRKGWIGSQPLKVSPTSSDEKKD